jgi:hypothetical protein
LGFVEESSRSDFRVTRSRAEYLGFLFVPGIASPTAKMPPVEVQR